MRLLVFLLRVGGSVMCLAFLAALLPESWMAAAHMRLSLGEFPSAPLTDYLTRSISLLYGIHGGLFLALSTNLPRYAPVVRYLMWMHILFGAAVLAIDLSAGMPWWWAGLEGPPIAGFAILNLYLLRFVPETGQIYQGRGHSAPSPGP